MDEGWSRVTYHFCICGEELVGSVMCWQTGAFERLFVIPRWRNKGLGKFLITKGFEYHIKNGRNEIYTMVNGQDKEAMLLLESMGYTFSVRMELKALYLLQEVGILT
ncbi:GNAT family N-acetyltransferase [Paenibacillus sp. XY044]|uniref:GNAT family N-acetyltransferase n=1 Tax=Paenibacillus sp. XY044 TaxID=2026089 RepID=UPI000B99C293|nr:hypothetical protein CJP46_24700 [Paenibacillus sp. XY044]